MTRDLHEGFSDPRRVPAGGCPGCSPRAGCNDVTATPFSFAFDEPVWRRIVDNTITASPAPTWPSWRGSTSSEQRPRAASSSVR